MRIAVVVLVCALISACATPSAPVYDRSSRPANRQSTPPANTRIKRPSYYRVRKGDTLYAIAWRYGLDYRTLARWNSIRAPFTIYPEQRVRLSAPPHQRPSRTASRPAPAKPKAPTVVATKPATKPPTVSQTKPRPATKPTSTASKPQPATTPKPATPKPQPAASNAAIKWSWPADGAILSSFSASDSGRKGIDIAGREGQEVRAAAAGEVVYSGVGLIGYGELIIIKHDRRYLSAYGHNRKRLVKEGDQVKAGQRIAEMGQSGTNRTKLHFEIRDNGTPVNPTRFLPRR